MMDSLTDVYFYCMPDTLLGKERIRGGLRNIEKRACFRKIIWIRQWIGSIVFTVWYFLLHLAAWLNKKQAEFSGLLFYLIYVF